MSVPTERDVMKSATAQFVPDPADSSVMTRQQIARGWNTVAWDSYGPILQFLEQQQRRFAPSACPVYAAGYDWRQSNEDSANYIANVVDTILQQENATKVILVTHSMGGIVARAACSFVSGFEAKVAGVIHTVQPAVGAPVAYRRFVDGAVDVPGMVYGIAGRARRHPRQ